uniref:Uncharacterized protein n=1 Tax=Lepeophtheirus salmonis TaxID=72036 RepID=A0A0K2U4K3_LEPSM
MLNPSLALQVFLQSFLWVRYLKIRINIIINLFCRL